MKIKMLNSSNGADIDENGVSLGVKSYLKGDEYEVGEELGEGFIKRKLAEPVSASPKKEEPENKDAGAPAENKAAPSKKKRGKKRASKK